MLTGGSPTRLKVHSLVAIHQWFGYHTPVYLGLASAHIFGSLQDGQLPFWQAVKVPQLFRCADTHPFLSGIFQLFSAYLRSFVSHFR